MSTNMDQLIRMRIANTDRDPYGQVKKINCTLSNLFPNPMERQKVEFYLKNNPESKFQISTYFWKHGTFKAVTLK